MPGVETHRWAALAPFRVMEKYPPLFRGAGALWKNGSQRAFWNDRPREKERSGVFSVA